MTKSAQINPTLLKNLLSKGDPGVPGFPGEPGKAGLIGELGKKVKQFYLLHVSILI